MTRAAQRGYYNLASAGSTVALSLGNNTRAATVTGTSWSYSLTAADITAMGQGAETLSVTQTDTAGNTSAAQTSRCRISDHSSGNRHRYFPQAAA